MVQKGKKGTIEQHEELLKIVRKLTLLSNVFMTVALKDQLACQHVMYVNTEVDDGTAVAKLMQFFKTTDPEDMSQGELSKKVKRMKEGEDEAMYDATNEFIELGRKYGLEDGKREGMEAVFKILNLFDEGKSLTDIAKIIDEEEEFVTQTLVKAKKIKE